MCIVTLIVLQAAKTDVFAYPGDNSVFVFKFSSLVVVLTLKITISTNVLLMCWILTTLSAQTDLISYCNLRSLLAKLPHWTLSKLGHTGPWRVSFKPSSKHSSGLCLCLSTSYTRLPAAGYAISDSFCYTKFLLSFICNSALWLVKVHPLSLPLSIVFLITPPLPPETHP